jgi:hypothetical protein
MEIRPQDFFLDLDSIPKLTAGTIFRAGVGMLKCRMERVIDNICQTRQPKVMIWIAPHSNLEIAKQYVQGISFLRIWRIQAVSAKQAFRGFPSQTFQVRSAPVGVSCLVVSIKYFSTHYYAVVACVLYESVLQGLNVRDCKWPCRQATLQHHGSPKSVDLQGYQGRNRWYIDLGNRIAKTCFEALRDRQRNVPNLVQSVVAA